MHGSNLRDVSTTLGRSLAYLEEETKKGHQYMFKKHNVLLTWTWVKIKPPGDRRFQSIFPFIRVPCWLPIFDTQPPEA